MLPITSGQLFERGMKVAIGASGGKGMLIDYLVSKVSKLKSLSKQTIRFDSLGICHEAFERAT